VSALRPNFWELPIAALTRPEWEALCDGCGQCCMHKVEDADTGEVYPTNVACKLLDLTSCRCSDYPHRKRAVPDCLQLNPKLAATLEWLPETCADWHYLLSGDRDAVHAAEVSVRGKAIPEAMAGPLENHAILPPGVEVWHDD
jgi:uncharacterized cysteine cluster protein YcgN (CxxCxxCC family)